MIRPLITSLTFLVVLVSVLSCHRPSAQVLRTTPYHYDKSVVSQPETRNVPGDSLEVLLKNGNQQNDSIAITSNQQLMPQTLIRPMAQNLEGTRQNAMSAPEPKAHRKSQDFNTKASQKTLNNSYGSKKPDGAVGLVIAGLVLGLIGYKMMTTPHSLPADMSNDIFIAIVKLLFGLLIAGIGYVFRKIFSN